MKRKIIQIQTESFQRQVVYHDGVAVKEFSPYLAVIALCDDGTLWELKNEKWRKIDNILEVED